MVLGDRYQQRGVHSPVLALIIPLGQAIRRVTDSNRLGRSQPLYSGGHIWCLAQRSLFLTPAAAHSTDNDQTRMYPKSYSQGDALGLGSRRLQRAQGFHHT